MEAEGKKEERKREREKERRKERKREEKRKPIVCDSKRLRVYVQNASVCTGKTRAC